MNHEYCHNIAQLICILSLPVFAYSAWQPEASNQEELGVAGVFHYVITIVGSVGLFLLLRCELKKN